MKEKANSTSESSVPLRIILLAPPAGVDFGMQEGKGNDFTILQKQRSAGGDVSFDVRVTVKDGHEDGLPNFLGPLTQGPPTGRFIYIGVGEYAGQKDTPWSRRVKVPLGAISWEMIRKAAKDDKTVIETRIPGTAKDGGPICASVKAEWNLRRAAE
jgi:hypothetical protein